jgi:hypothetical protein
MPNGRKPRNHELKLTDDTNERSQDNPTKETLMNTLDTLSRDFTCALAATLITAVMGLSFISSTAVVPGSHSPVHTVALQTEHAWFGQPEPAVLVD